ncbi:hypothetical protein K502DRAFT_312807 [Neoconidiobolus thromboides FSU 785]|nr:hypothetical protein K502DRAFT_312807 [Neoconidiobolus thromboides FSU 785]
MSIASDIILVTTFIGIPQVAGFISTSAISQGREYYNSINKPIWAPPHFVLRPLQTLFYGLMGISSYLVFNASMEQDLGIKTALLLYAIQLFFSFVWPTAFFKLKSNILALFTQALSLLSLITTVVIFESIDDTAAKLLVPYLVWSVFVGYLNKVIWRRNQKGYIDKKIVQKVTAVTNTDNNESKNAASFCSCCGNKID